ncbi:polyamine aminopropyltransferase [Podospora fimiseda]|uniref:Polyamine aminopropyltransferase n=1 Tax=Podospora fimiseda TaxID=252190 RepID=A0AAN7H539_9PEZI|nr:polyamine aminopropyltransferase [Podospora fimiseda]
MTPGLKRKPSPYPGTPSQPPAPQPIPITKTPQQFEQELLSLAAKARTQMTSAFLLQQLTIYLKCLLLLSLIAIYSIVSQLNLSPVYGSIPSAKYHFKLVIAACFVGWSSNLALGRSLPFKPEKLLPVIAVYVPVAQFYLAKFSDYFTAYYGPLITELLTLFPLVVVSTGCVATYLDGSDLGIGSKLPSFIGEALPGLGSFGFFRGAQTVLGGLIEGHVGKSLVNTRIGMEAVLAASYAVFAPGKLLLLTIPGLLHTALLNTHVQTDVALVKLNEGLRGEGYVVLDRKESLTGYISVIDGLEMGFRLMRCDHSLLGGEWTKLIGQPGFEGNQVAEPVYGVFAMLEAVRLVETTRERVKDEEAKALVIGLGIGTTPAALVAHGIDTTVVEIDPVVHEFATKYFQLPKNHTAVIEDAVSYTDRLAADEKGQRYDYIIHDVFTGGAEPIPLFTLEFLQNLNTLLKPDGVVAINYAGDLALPPPRIIVETIKSVFPTCRSFREHPRDEKVFKATGGDFTNMVIFCTKKTGGKLKFRYPTERDMLNSPSRRHFLMPQHEVKEEDFVKVSEESAGVLRRNETERLVKWHEMSATGHWGIMRTVLNGSVWEGW